MTDDGRQMEEDRRPQWSIPSRGRQRTEHPTSNTCPVKPCFNGIQRSTFTLPGAWRTLGVRLCREPGVCRRRQVAPSRPLCNPRRVAPSRPLRNPRRVAPNRPLCNPRRGRGVLVMRQVRG